MGQPTVVLLTDVDHPELHPDDEPLRAAFIEAGWKVEPVIWSGEVPNADLAVIRSTWDYTGRITEYLAAIDSVAARMPLWNPAATVRWNSDKSYLLELARAGVMVPATVVVRRGSEDALAAVLARLDCDELVAKPLVGAGGYRTLRLGAGDEVEWRAAVAHEDLLVQEYIPEVVSSGEWSLLHFGGEYSHAVLKQARQGEFRVQPQHGGASSLQQPESALRTAAEAALAAVQHPWAYARVDGVITSRGFLLMEIELIEPQLFLREHPAAARQLVRQLLAAA